MGSALHELAHALGFQGHPKRGDSILVRDPRALLKASVAVGRGDGFRDATLSALYALPSGTVLSRRPLPPRHTAALDAAAARAAAEGRRGPYLQVGDRLGRISWYGDDGSALAFRLRGLKSALQSPAKLEIEPLP